MKKIVSVQVPTKLDCVVNAKYTRDGLYVLNEKWNFQLIYTLRESPLGFNEILHLVDNITPKILGKELKDLEINDFVGRKVYLHLPVTIMYEHTPYSDTLKNVLNKLSQWGEQHREKRIQSIRAGKADFNKVG